MAIGNSSSAKRFSGVQDAPLRSRKSSASNLESTGRKVSNSDDPFITFQKTERSRSDSSEAYPKRRRVKEKEPQPSQPHTTPKTPVSGAPESGTPSTTPVSAVEPVTKPDSSSEMKTLAEKYVAQYEKQSGKALSSTDRASLVADVQEFYSDPSRAGRLKSFVEGTA